MRRLFGGFLLYNPMGGSVLPPLPPIIANIGNMQAFLISQHLLPRSGEKGLGAFILDSI